MTGGLSADPLSVASSFDLDAAVPLGTDHCESLTVAHRGEGLGQKYPFLSGWKITDRPGQKL
jgi:hypothetical protein